MSYRVQITKSAERDIREIHGYIAEKLKSPTAAIRRVDLIDKKVQSLSEKPHRHPLVLDEFLASKGFRYIAAENHHVFYVIYDKIKIPTVYAVRVIYGRRDWANILKDDIENIFDEISNIAQE